MSYGKNLEERAADRAKVAESAPVFDRQFMQQVAKERIDEISQEFTKGFDFLADYPKSVTFFGSNQFLEDSQYYQSARTLAGRIAKELGYSVISGGGPGIMEAANRGAFEACEGASSAAGTLPVCGPSLGLTIELPHGQVVNKFIDRAVDSYYFFVRKVLLSFSAEAFIFYPGGFGTLDEFFEIITLVQTGKITGVPIICVGSDYWQAMHKFMEDELLARGTILSADLKLFTITDNHDEILKIIKDTPVRAALPFSGGLKPKS